MRKWIDTHFESSCSHTVQFNNFSKDFIKNLRKKFKGTDIELDKISIGHFGLSGFFKKDNKFVYFSISDVRYFKNEWFNSILIRTAENNKDFTGGMNNYSPLIDIVRRVDTLMNIQPLMK